MEATILPKPLGPLGYLKNTVFNEFWVSSSRGDHEASRYLSKIVLDCGLLTEYFDWVEKTHGCEKADQLRKVAQISIQKALRE